MTPVTCPEAFSAFPVLELPSSVPKSCISIVFGSQKNACLIPFGVSEYPVTCPEAFIAEPALEAPPNVPRSVIV
jgi:hypothetical protein